MSEAGRSGVSGGALRLEGEVKVWGPLRDRPLPYCAWSPNRPFLTAYGKTKEQARERLIRAIWRGVRT